MSDVRSQSPDPRRVVEEMAGRLSTWDRWTSDDGVGALHLVTEEKRLEASDAIRTGAAFSLGFELRAGLPQPPGSGRLNPQHVMTELPSDAGAGEEAGVAQTPRSWIFSWSTARM